MLVFLLLRKCCEFVIMGDHKDVDSGSYIGGIRMQAFPNKYKSTTQNSNKHITHQPEQLN